MIRVLSFASIIVTLVFAACGEEEVPAGYRLTDAEVKEIMMSYDTLRAGSEEREIKAFLAKKAWPVVDAKTGLRFYIFDQAHQDSIHPKEGDIVHVRYEVRLLNDTLCYSNLEDEQPKSFMVELDDIESGVHEGVTKMTVGDKAHLVMPSIRAHGLLGDLDMIPPASPLWINIELVALEKRSAL